MFAAGAAVHGPVLGEAGLAAEGRLEASAAAVEAELRPGGGAAGISAHCAASVFILCWSSGFGGNVSTIFIFHILLFLQRFNLFIMDHLQIFD